MKRIATYDEKEHPMYEVLQTLCNGLPLDRQWNNQRFHTEAFRKDKFEFRFHYGEINFVEVHLI